MIRTSGDNYLGAVAVALLSSLLSYLALASILPTSTLVIVKWSCAQWMPFPLDSFGRQWQNESWSSWEESYMTDSPNIAEGTSVLEIPNVQVQDFPDPNNLLQHLIDTYGDDWRRRPLLLENLWSGEALTDSSKTRRISKAGLLTENLTIPYFRDARILGALAPNDKAPIRDIMVNITQRSAPHKIASQFLVQTYPELILEVAPNSIVTTLFGNHFEPKDVECGAFGIPFLPALTTVPLFVAGTFSSPTEASTDTTDSPHAFTALHCEPIGNVAVQLEGEKHWTLVSPEYSFLMKPKASPDGRAYFVSEHASEAELGEIPHYHATTGAGDALWIPTWTWHRVDYKSKQSDNEGSKSTIAIGASLFHLRPMELIKNNPLFCFLVIPNLVKEVLGINTQ